MQQRIWLCFWVKVICFSSQNLNVGCKQSRCYHGFWNNFEWFFGQLLNSNDQHKYQNSNQCRVNSFDSSTVKISVRKLVFESLFDNDARNQVPWNDEKYINTNESAWHEKWPSMKKNNDANSDSSQTINVSSIMNYMFWLSLFFLLFLIELNLCKFFWLWKLVHF